MLLPINSINYTYYESKDKLDDSYSGRWKIFLIVGYQHLFHIDIASFKTALTIG